MNTVDILAALPSMEKKWSLDSIAQYVDGGHIFQVH
jgi:hypothetical protein